LIIKKFCLFLENRHLKRRLKRERRKKEEERRKFKVLKQTVSDWMVNNGHLKILDSLRERAHIESM